MPELALAAATLLTLAQDPAAPSEASQPATPSEASQPAAQAQASQPAAPSEASQPAAPQLAAPSESSRPAAPSGASQPAAPSAASRPAAQAPGVAEPRPRWWGPFPRPKVSGYGGPALRLSGLHGAFAAFVGIEGGINILQRVTVGASLLWLLNPVDAGAYARGPATRLNLNYGGLVVDVAYVKGQRVAGTIGGLLGGGGACVQDPENGRCADRTAFFVGEPRAGLRVVLAPIVRLHLALGYRLIAGRAWTGPPDARLGGPSGSIALEFGWF